MLALPRSRTVCEAATILFGVPVLGILAWGQVVTARSQRRLARAAAAREFTRGAAGGTEAVLVLGYGNRGGQANAVNRWRAEIALRSIDPSAARTVLITSGGALHGVDSEAAILACHLRQDCGYTGELRQETTSTTTGENIARSIPLVEGADRIVIASDPLHAERARALLAVERPDLAARVVPAAAPRPGEHPLLVTWAAIVGLEGLRRNRRDGLIPPAAPARPPR
ncbi:MAG: YdcF family protein [Brachybacterium sp.]|nr:YdcF family protein [Brachybacterium sp.]